MPKLSKKTKSMKLKRSQKKQNGGSYKKQRGGSLADYQLDQLREMITNFINSRQIDRTQFLALMSQCSYDQITSLEEMVKEQSVQLETDPNMTNNNKLNIKNKLITYFSSMQELDKLIIIKQ
jgi:hypothetical protein